MKLLACLLFCVSATVLAGDTFTIVQGSAENHVTFTSDAPLEEIVGKTHMVTGFVTLPDADSPGHAEIHVDLASLNTGLNARDKHMRENHLETDKYPEAVFRLTKLELPAGGLTTGIQTTVSVSGTLDLHGVKRDITPTASLMLTPSGELQIESDFTVLLADHQIERPEFLIMKLSEEQRIRVTLVAYPSR